MTECDLCKFKAVSNRGLAKHLKHHNMTFFEYLNRNRAIPKCRYCDKDCKQRRLGFCATCASKECLSILLKSRKHSEVSKECIREKRLAYLKRKTGKTAWERRSRGEMSYLEMWFQEDVVLKYNLHLTHQIITEYFIDRYFIDFAFLDKKIAVELDGQCHFVNGTKRIEHDKIRDERLLLAGWQTIRIPHYLAIHETQKIIDSLLVVLESGDTAPLDWVGQYKHSTYVKKIKVKPANEKSIHEKFKNKRNKEKTTKLKNADIDYSKFGWVGKASEVIGIRPAKVRKWINKNVPELLVDSFCRKLPNITAEEKERNAVTIKEVLSRHETKAKISLSLKAMHARKRAEKEQLLALDEINEIIDCKIA